MSLWFLFSPIRSQELPAHVTHRHLTMRSHMPLPWWLVAQSLPVQGKHMHNFLCATLKCTGKVLEWVPAVFCHSGCLSLPAENCLDAYKADGYCTPRYVPGNRLREIKTEPPAMKLGAAPRSLCTEEPRWVQWCSHHFPGRIQDVKGLCSGS